MRWMVSVVVAVLMCGAGAAAQKPKGQVDKKAEPTNVTVTGCLARGSEGGSVLLTHASKADAMATPKASAAKDKMAKNAVAKTTTYALLGGVGLDAHLGHKMEIAGTMTKPLATTGGKPGMLPRRHEAVTVKTVKMLSASCP